MFITDHDGTRWVLGAHSVHRGKAGWSGTDEWHLHKIVEPAQLDDNGWLLGPFPADAGRWVAHPGKIQRAKAIAAWMITNPRLYEAAVLSETERLAFPAEVSQ